MQITEVRIKLTAGRNEKLRAFCSITIDNDFVIRDLKVIEGSKGAFVAMPSRKLMSRCYCGRKNHYRARFCNECGRKLEPGEAVLDGRRKLHADVAHPINSQCREIIQDRVLELYHGEREKAKDPDYTPMDLDVYDDDDFFEGEELSTTATSDGAENRLERAAVTEVDVDEAEWVEGDLVESAGVDSTESRESENAFASSGATDDGGFARRAGDVPEATASRRGPKESLSDDQGDGARRSASSQRREGRDGGSRRSRGRSRSRGRPGAGGGSGTIGREGGGGGGRWRGGASPGEAASRREGERRPTEIRVTASGERGTASEERVTAGRRSASSDRGGEVAVESRTARRGLQRDSPADEPNRRDSWQRDTERVDKGREDAGEDTRRVDTGRVRESQPAEKRYKKSENGPEPEDNFGAGLFS